MRVARYSRFFFTRRVGALAGFAALFSMTAAMAPAQTVHLPGELAAWEKVGITARVPGIVEQVHVDRGSVVKQGQPLVDLSAPEMAAQVAEAEAKRQGIEAQRVEAEAKRVAAQSTYERLQQAAKTQGAVAQNDVIQAEKAVEAATALIDALKQSAQAAQAQVQALKELQSYLKITAPFGGVITERLVHPGALASPSSGALLELEQVGRLRLVVSVPEAELGRLPRGSKIVFTVPAYPGKSFSGVVARPARSLDAKTRTMPVELDVDNASGQLAPGMYCDVLWPSTAVSPKAAAK